MTYICGPSSEEWNRMSDKEKEDFKQSYEDINNFAEKIVKEDELLKKISSQKLLQELINRKVLTRIPVGLYKEFELRRKYKNRDKSITYDGVYLLNSSEKDF